MAKPIIATMRTSRSNDSKLLFEALAFAARAHHGQVRKGSDLPYIHHPLEVGKILHSFGYNVEVIAAGYLHDTLEDTATTLEELRELFGTKVAEFVKGASEPEELVKGDFGASSKAPWDVRKRHTIHYLEADAPLEVVAIVCADKTANLRDLRDDLQREGESYWSIFTAPREKQAWYFRSLAEIFKKRMTVESDLSLRLEFDTICGELFP